jgi:sRNA-binding protein
VRPFAIGIHREILQALPDVKSYVLRDAIQLYQWESYGAYVKSILAGGHRYNLAGEPTGEVTAKDQEHAEDMLEERSARWHARRATRTGGTPALSEQREPH